MKLDLPPSVRRRSAPAAFGVERPLLRLRIDPKAWRALSIPLTASKAILTRAGLAGGKARTIDPPYRPLREIVARNLRGVISGKR